MSNEAEAQALLEGIKLAVSVGCEALVIEGDSQVVISDVRRSKAVSWNLDFFISNIIHWLSRIPTWSLRHNYRESNSTDDFLANQRIMRRDGPVISTHANPWEELNAIISQEGRVAPGEAECRGGQSYSSPFHQTPASFQFGSGVGRIWSGSAVVGHIEEARRVIVVLSARNVELMKFASNVHGACSAKLSEGSRLKKLALPELSAPVVFAFEGVATFRRKMGFMYNFLLRTAR
ncbi:hypothetical protein KI387_023081, partial [Taxus chinensis]